MQSPEIIGMTPEAILRSHDGFRDGESRMEIHAVLRGVGTVRILEVAGSTARFLLPRNGKVSEEHAHLNRANVLFSEVTVSESRRTVERREQAVEALTDAFGGGDAREMAEELRTILAAEDAARTVSFPHDYYDEVLRQGISQYDARDAREKIRTMLEAQTPILITVPRKHLATILREGIRKQHRFGIKATLGAPLFAADEVMREERVVVTIEDVAPTEIDPIFIDRATDAHEMKFRGIVEFRSASIAPDRIHLVREAA